MKTPSQEHIQSLRKRYPAGSRVTLNHMNDPYHPVEPGTTGTLKYIDDMGTFHMLWDNGRTLGLIYGVDSFSITPPAQANRQDTLSARLATAEEKKTQISSSAPAKQASEDRSDDIDL